MNDTDPRLLKALSSLNRIGAAINHIGAGEPINIETTLHLIAESATRVVPGASAVIYTCDPAGQAFEPASRVPAPFQKSPYENRGLPQGSTAGERTPLAAQKPVVWADDAPRPDGLGMRAIRQRRPVLSYEEYDLTMHPAPARAGAKVAACFPLLVAEQAMGALYIYLRRERHFTQLELLMLENFVNQAAMAIYHARQIARHAEDLARREDEALRLRRAGLLISSRVGLEETLKAILHMALEVIDAQYGIIRLLDRSGQYLIARAVAGEGLSKPLTEALPIHANSIMGWVARQRQAVRIPDLRCEPWAHIYYPLDSELEMRSEIAVPLIGAGNRLEGVLNLESPAVDAFSEQDGHLLQSLAILAVIAIQEARLLDALQEVTGRLLSQPAQQVLERLVELACDLLNGASSAIWLVRGDHLILQASSADDRRGQRGDSLPLHSSLTGQAVLSGKPVTAEDVRSDPHFSRTSLAQAHNWQRALIVPILSSDKGEPMGAISVYRAAPDPERFSESGWDVKVLTCLAHYASLAVQNHARQQALQAAQEQRAVAETFAAVGDIAANLLHQLNNKVGTIPVRVQGIQDKCQAALSADPYLAANLAEIERSASQAMEAVRDNLLHLHPIHLAPVHVAGCVQAALSSTHPPAHVRVEVEGLDELPPVMAGGRSLTMVFTNLLENAAEAMQGGGTITIRGSAIPLDRVKIAIMDSGPGIAPDLHERIFEFNFSQRTPGQIAQPRRLGFGLWWVKTLMTRLGGSVSVESDGRHGTTFWLSLPQASEDR